MTTALTPNSYLPRYNQMIDRMLIAYIYPRKHKVWDNTRAQGYGFAGGLTEKYKELIDDLLEKGYTREQCEAEHFYGCFDYITKSINGRTITVKPMHLNAASLFYGPVVDSAVASGTTFFPGLDPYATDEATTAHREAMDTARREYVAEAEALLREATADGTADSELLGASAYIQLGDVSQGLLDALDRLTTAPDLRFKEARTRRPPSARITWMSCQYLIGFCAQGHDHGPELNLDCLLMNCYLR